MIHAMTANKKYLKLIVNWNVQIVNVSNMTQFYLITTEVVNRYPRRVNRS